MSRVILIAADKALPLCDLQQLRTKTSTLPDGESFVLDYEAGFRIEPHAYYQPAVDALGYTVKPFQYELDFEAVEQDLCSLQRYLRQNFAPGEQLELWSVWVGDGEHPELIRITQSVGEIDLAVLEQLLWADQLCITVKI